MFGVGKYCYAASARRRARAWALAGEERGGAYVSPRAQLVGGNPDHVTLAV